MIEPWLLSEIWRPQKQLGASGTPTSLPGWRGADAVLRPPIFLVILTLNGHRTQRGLVLMQGLTTIRPS